MKGRWVNGPGFFCILLMASIGASYWPAIMGPFVWDDPIIIGNNPLVTSKEGILGIWFGSRNIEYLPLTYSLFWLEWMCWGGWVPGWHAVNILLHLLNAILIWRILVCLGIKWPKVGSLIFALHPVNVATVAWISEGKNTLSMAFFCYAMLLFLKKQEQKISGSWWTSPFPFFVMALLSKTSAVVFPPLMILTSWWRRGRIVKSDLIRMIPYMMASFALGVVGVCAQNHVIGGREIFMGELTWRLAIAGQHWWFYLGKILFPVHLSMLYPRVDNVPLDLLAFIPLVAAIAGLTAAWLFRKTMGRSVFFALSFYSIAIFPVLGFFKMYYFSLSRVADHWLYLPSVGIIALFTAALARLSERISARVAVRIAAILLCVLLGIMTNQRARLFADNEIFWKDVLEKDPGSYSALINLGCISQSVDPDRARSFFLKASQLRSDGAEAYFSLGACEIKLGMFHDAASHLREGMKITRFDPQSHYLLGVAYQNLGCAGQAIPEFLETLQLNGRFSMALTKLAASYLAVGDTARAIVCLEEARKTGANQADMHDLLGQVGELSGDVDQAKEEYLMALEIDPNLSHSQERLEELNNSSKREINRIKNRNNRDNK
jgi:tetratricopeptide (TPR) repeat protein